jgi:hypothetical protein
VTAYADGEVVAEVVLWLDVEASIICPFAAVYAACSCLPLRVDELEGDSCPGFG